MIIAERIYDHVEAIKKINAEINEHQVKLGISRNDLWSQYVKLCSAKDRPFSTTQF